MESKNIQESNEAPSVTFSHLEDVKDYMMFIVDTVATKQRAAGQMAALGIAENSASMNEARRDTRRSAQLLMSVYGEFKRLHSGNCNCPITDEQIDEAISAVQELISDIDKSQAHADALPPISRADEVDGMISSLGAILGGRMDGFGPVDTSGVRDASGGSTGTGMYL